jgi:hypothetical protein
VDKATYKIILLNGTTGEGERISFGIQTFTPEGNKTGMNTGTITRINMETLQTMSSLSKATPITKDYTIRHDFLKTNKGGFPLFSISSSGIVDLHTILLNDRGTLSSENVFSVSHISITSNGKVYLTSST